MSTISKGPWPLKLRGPRNKIKSGKKSKLNNLLTTDDASCFLTTFTSDVITLILKSLILLRSQYVQQEKI